VFTGDTLFISGCGRFFEGTAEQMYHALINILSKLPEATVYCEFYIDLKNYRYFSLLNFRLKQVYCGHEYSVANLKFSLHVEPDNEVTADKLRWATEQRAKNLRTIPSTIGQELSFNPFMRVNLDKLKSRYNQTDSILCMQSLRKEKDGWKPT